LVDSEDFFDGVTDRVFMLFDSSCIASKNACSSITPVFTVGPIFSREGCSYEGEDLKYDGTVKVEVESPISNFWKDFKSQSLDEIAVHVWSKREEAF
jgi:hypothetical protein